MASFTKDGAMHIVNCTIAKNVTFKLDQFELMHYSLIGFDEYSMAFTHSAVHSRYP